MPTPPRALLVIAASPLTAPENPRRFGPDLSAEAAAQIAAAFLLDTTRTARALPARAGVAVALTRRGGTHPPGVTPRDLPAFPERGNHPGELLVNSMEDGFGAGYDAVCVIGPDAPHLPAAFVLEAFGRLARHPDAVVLGPADGGGYYLVGAAGRTPRALFEGIPWNTDAVLRATLGRAVAHDVSVTLLPSWYAADTTRSLARLRRDLRRGVAVAPESDTTLRRLGAAAP